MRGLLSLGGLALAVLVAFALAMLIVVPTLNPPADDVRQLFLYMSATGLGTVSAAYLLYRLRLLQRLLNLRWTLFTIIALTIVLIFANVWITAQLMFISEHDLVLTTGLLIFAGLVAAAAALMIAAALRERIDELSRGIRALSTGQWDTRLPAAGSDELTGLAHIFNQTAARLQALDDQQRALAQMRRDLIAWASHDLRTPLAAVRAMNEALIDGVVTDPADVRRYQANIQSEIQHLSRLIDDLFELAQLDTGRLPLARQMTALPDLISDTLSGASARAARQGVTLTAHVDPAVQVVDLAPDKIQRVLRNLVENALAYTPPGGCITLRAHRVPGQVVVSVHNTGSTIAAQDLPHIFDSFYRGEQSRKQGEGQPRGTGLGLAIVRGFIEAHGGAIRADSSPTTGTTFTFTLPA